MRLIDADKLLEVIVKRKRPENGADCSKERYSYMQWLVDYWAIKDAPTIDAVEVIQCKHCRRWLNGDDTYGTCQWNEYQTLQTRYDDYCSHAERND